VRPPESVTEAVTTYVPSGKVALTEFHVPRRLPEESVHSRFPREPPSSTSVADLRKVIEVPCNTGPVIPERKAFPHEFTENTRPTPVDPVIGCTRGPPDDPPNRSHVPSHWSPYDDSVLRGSSQYTSFGSTS
jgi:hypothetical protein